MTFRVRFFALEQAQTLFTLRWRYFWRKSNQNVGDGVDRRQWRMKGDGGPPARGMSRSDKGSAGSGEDGKVTSGQEGLQPIAVRDDNFSGHLPEESLQLKKHKNNCSTESCRAKILRLVTLAQDDILPL